MSYNLLKGKRGVIFGALNEMSIAWKVAEKAVEEGAVITLSNTPMAVRMGEITALGEKLNAEIIPADATNVEDLEKVFARSMEVLGGKIDFVLHSIGMSPNVRKKRPYDIGYGPAEEPCGTCSHHDIVVESELSVLVDVHIEDVDAMALALEPSCKLLAYGLELTVLPCPAGIDTAHLHWSVLLYTRRPTHIESAFKSA